MPQRGSQSGFSLVELSIVLVILGLLTGGILAGQSLIRASELRSITAQYNNYRSAVLTFKDKYFALPGDMNNAEQFWGQVAVADAACTSTAATDTKTCNGDGNGRILASTRSYEVYRAWQHLVNAGLIEGQYGGAANATPTPCLGRCPQGKLGNSQWLISYNPSAVPNGNISYALTFIGDYGNMLLFTVPRYIGLGWQIQPLLKPEEVWNIDTKMDDGMPGTGSVLVMVNYLLASGLAECTNVSGAAATHPTQTGASYLLSQTNNNCSIIFRNQF